jgi:hypothetical protein
MAVDLSSQRHDHRVFFFRDGDSKGHKQTSLEFAQANFIIVYITEVMLKKERVHKKTPRGAPPRGVLKIHEKTKKRACA